MLEFRSNPDNPQLEVIVFTSIEVCIGYINPFNDIDGKWTFNCKDGAFMYAEEIIEIADKLKELNEDSKAIS